LLDSIGPLDKNPVGELEKVVNKLRLKYRWSTVEYDVEDVGVPISPLFVRFICLLKYNLTIDRTSVNLNFKNNLPPFTSVLSYRHKNNLQIDMVKNLTEYDACSCYLVWFVKCNLFVIFFLFYAM